MIKKKPKLIRVFWLVVEILPVALPAFVAAFGAVAVLFLLLNTFNPWYVWPLGLLVGSTTSFFVFKNYPREEPSKARNTCNILVIVGVVLWGGFNIMYTSQHIMVNRDPAIYANAGIWLTKHDSLNIPTTSIVSGGLTVNNGGAGFAINTKDTTHYQAQGTHVLPAFLGLAGRIFGVAKIFHINILFGISALLAIYGFARYLVKRPWWAVVVTGALSASMPFIYFSRDTYSEPLATTFTFGALSLVWLAVKSKKYSVWFLAGFVAAAAAMTRIDGYLTVAASMVFLVVILALSKRSDRKYTINASLLFVAGMVITGLIGWLDVTQLSVVYFKTHPQMYQELIAIIIVIVVGILLVWLAWKTNLLKRLDKHTSSWRAEAGAIAVPLFVLILYTRPFWLYGHYGYMSDGVRRSFAEISTQWISWYIGSVLAILGVVGAAYCVYRVLNKKDKVVLYFLFVVGMTALVYLIKPSIYPDQIWGSRRLMPIVIPGVAVFGAIMLDWLSAEFLPKVSKKSRLILTGVVSLAIVFVPLTVSLPLLNTRVYAQLGTMNNICANLPENTIVVWVGGNSILTMMQPTKGICDFEAVGYDDVGTKSERRIKSDLHKISKDSTRHGLIPVIAGQSDAINSLPDFIKDNTKVITDYKYDYLDRTNLGPPQKVMTSSKSIEAGFIMSNGDIQPSLLLQK